MRSPGFEIGVMISGQLQMHFEGRSFDLNAGDSNSLRVDEAHFSINPSSTILRFWSG